ncbi:MAG: hypothetical protein Q9173_004495 [Seirophora scorigena]
MVLSTNPTITRFLSLLSSLTFAGFHQILPIAFGRTNSHMHTFSVDVDPRHEIEGGLKVWPPTRVLHLQTHPLPMGVWLEPQDEGVLRLCDVSEKKEWEAEDGTPVGTGPGEGKVTL